MAAIPTETKTGELIFVPDPLVATRQIRIRVDRKAGMFGLYFTEDGGKTLLPLLLVPTKGSKVQPGSFLTIGDDGSVEWNFNPVVTEKARLSQIRGVPIPLTSSHIGSLYTSALFGLLTSPRGRVLQIKELHLTLQTTADQDVIIEIVDSTGAKLPNAGNNWIGTIATGQRTGIARFNTPLKLDPGSSYRIKIVQCGTSLSSGEVLEVRAVCELVS